jgi:transposase
MDEKVRFVAAVLAEERSMSELCASFGVSRKTGYKWLARYAQHGPEGLHELSRAPHRVPWAIAEARAEAILGVRRAHPSWGPKKLRAKLLQRAPQQVWPAPSTIGELLRRKGLVQARKRRRHAVANPVSRVRVAARDPLGQRRALRFARSRRPEPARRVVGQAGNHTGAHRTGQARAERAPRADAPHA